MTTTRTARRSVSRAAPRVAAVVACVLAFASWAEAQPREQSYRWGGDRLNARRLPDGERVNELIGNAFYEEPGLRATGDRGRYFSQRELIELVGDVLVDTDSLDLWTDSLRVFRRTEVGYAYGSVKIQTEEGAIGVGDRAKFVRDEGWLALIGEARVIDGPNVIEGDSIVIRDEEATIEAWGAVQMVDEESRSVVQGHHALLERDRGIATVDSMPVLRSRQGSGPMTIVISDWLRFDEDADLSTAIGNVNFAQGTTRAYADTARFYGEDLLVMTGEPRVEQEARVMGGREIRFVYVDGVIDRIDVFGDASLVDSTPDTLGREFTGLPLANTLNGDTLRINIEDGEITRTVVRGNAKSVYLPEDQSTTISVNEVEGQSIDIAFRDGKVDEVDVKGQVKGTYRYLERKLIGDRQRDRAAAADSLREAGIEPAPGDSALAVSPPDSAFVVAPGDSVLEESALADAPVGSGAAVLVDFGALADAVDYSGESTVFAVQRGRIHISETGQVRNGSLELFAEDIYFDTEARELLAEGDPRLIDEGSELVGQRMGYLFDPQTGAVADAATRFQEGFYTIRHARRIDSNTLLAEDGIYTECELEEPHYHFHAKRMKLKIGQSVVARQVTFYVSDIPLMTLPFFYKDLKKGRRSGILFPQVNVGVNSRQGRYVRDFGYYWATNDYTDFRFEMDFNERREASFTVENRYRQRYGVDGNVRFEYLRRFEQPSGGQFGDEWKLTARHNQPELFDVWRANATIDISSSNLTQNLSNAQVNTVLQSELRSTANVSRNFENGASLSLGLNRTQYPNSEDEDLTTNNRLSNLALNTRLGFRTTKLLGGRKRNDSPLIANVLRDINFSQGYSSAYRRDVTENSLSNVLNANGSLGLTWSPESVGPFKLSSAANFSETWTYEDIEVDAYQRVLLPGPDGEEQEVFVSNPDAARRVDGARTEPSLSFTNRIQSDLYGTFPTRIGPLLATRHQVTYSADHTYRPQLGDRQEASQSIGLNVTNRFSFKLRDGGRRDEDEEERTRKLQNLLTWSLSTSIDPEAEPGERWRDIQSTVNVVPGVTRAVTLSATQTIDPYTLEVTRSEIRPIVSLNLRGDFDLGGVLRAREERQNRLLERLPEAEPDTAVVDSLALDLDPDDDYVSEEEQRRERERWLESGDDNRVPWDIAIRGSFTRSSQKDGPTTTRANVSLNGNLALPGAWKLTYRAGFDVDSGEFTNQYISLNRQLHHWRLEFTRQVAGISNRESEFGFRLYLEPLPDLSVDRGPLARGGGFGNRLSGF